MSLAKVTVVLLLVLSIALAAWAQQATVQVASHDAPAFDLSSLDKTCQPCRDFNQFANGGWIARNTIPAAYPAWGRFSELAERNRDTLHEILEIASHHKSAGAGTNEQKIGDYYAACMDETKINAAGLEPLASEIGRIAKINDPKGLLAEVSRLHQMGVGALFSFSARQDFKNSSEVIGQARQGGLGMPDRDYYLKDDEKSKSIRDAYLNYITKIFTLTGDSSTKAAEEARLIMTLETKLAGASMTRVQQRDPNAVYHKMTLTETSALTPAFSWTDYLRQIGADPTRLTSINVAQPEFFKELNTELIATPLEGWKTYLRFHLIRSAAPSLSATFVDANFDFYGRALTGTPENLPRWKRCVSAVDANLGEALGQVYVQKTFPPEAKARALVMVNNLVAALRDDLTTLPWMGDATRQQAIAKLNAFAKKIGYPDKWRDYSILTIKRDSYLDDQWSAARFEFARVLNKIGKPVDRTEWGMTPSTVNAYNNSTMNEIVFPAGILQPPFFDPKADDAINYGGIGAVIGHEMTHGFDDQGSQFNAEGNLKNWWLSADLKNFKDRATCVEHQFDNYFVEDNLHLNGKLVVGESIADLGGLTVAYAAFQKALASKHQRPSMIDGFTPEQRFFLGWAQVWASNQRPEYSRLLVNTDPHPLARFRVNGPLSNMPAFAEAFGCKVGDRMVRPAAERCQIW